jgi:hypothetical protein
VEASSYTYNEAYINACELETDGHPPQTFSHIFNEINYFPLPNGLSNNISDRRGNE